ncbi:MAG: hypothetical protein JWR72_4244 [Flavisolibacter sp.]|nr:hypothetical protein [Flavisolibacter sp.]
MIDGSCCVAIRTYKSATQPGLIVALSLVTKVENNGRIAPMVEQRFEEPTVQVRLLLRPLKTLSHAYSCNEIVLHF